MPEFNVLLYLLVFVVMHVVTDALRDRWRSGYAYIVKRDAILLSGPRLDYLFSRPWLWWRWHMVKWINFYLPHLFIVYLLWPYLKWYELVLAALFFLFIWRRIYNYRGRKTDMFIGQE